MLSETDPNGQTTYYNYDGDRRLTSTHDSLSRYTTTTYDAWGNVLTELRRYDLDS